LQTCHPQAAKQYAKLRQTEEERRRAEGSLPGNFPVIAAINDGKRSFSEGKRPGRRSLVSVSMGLGKSSKAPNTPMLIRIFLNVCCFGFAVDQESAVLAGKRAKGAKRKAASSSAAASAKRGKKTPGRMFVVWHRK
jgi:hypothetical protein